MSEKLIIGCLIVIGVIHLLPTVGAISATRVEQLYDVVITGPDMAVLMRHRAVLFGLIGGLCLWAVFAVHLRTAAFVLAAVSVLAFFYLAWSVGGINQQLQRVVLADVVAIIAVLIGAAAHLTRVSTN